MAIFYDGYKQGIVAFQTYIKTAYDIGSLLSGQHFLPVTLPIYREANGYEELPDGEPNTVDIEVSIEPKQGLHKSTYQMLRDISKMKDYKYLFEKYFYINAEGRYFGKDFTISGIPVDLKIGNWIYSQGRWIRSSLKTEMYVSFLRLTVIYTNKFFHEKEMMFNTNYHDIYNLSTSVISEPYYIDNRYKELSPLSLFGFFGTTYLGNTSYKGLFYLGKGSKYFNVWLYLYDRKEYEFSQVSKPLYFIYLPEKTAVPVFYFYARNQIYDYFDQNTLEYKTLGNELDGFGILIEMKPNIPLLKNIKERIVVNALLYY